MEPQVDLNQYLGTKSTGYQANQLLEYVPEGYETVPGTEVTASKEVGPRTNPKSWLKLQRPGLFGHCQEISPIKFMKHINTQECAITAKSCADLQFKKLGIQGMFSQSGRQGTIIKTEVG